MDSIFVLIIKMSLAASVAAILIMVFRWIFNKKIPRVYFYTLWSIVLIRLLVPFSFPSGISIFNIISVPQTITLQSQDNNAPIKNASIPGNIDAATWKGIDYTKPISDFAIKHEVTPVNTSLNKNQENDAYGILPWVWFVGMLAFLVISLFTYFSALKRLSEAVIYKDNNLISACMKKLRIKRSIKVYISESINTPMVCGVIKPRVILPNKFVNSFSEADLMHIVTHELVHIKRHDILIKPLSVLVLCLHWFNPLIWLSFLLSQKDMEMSCDAKVLDLNGTDIRAEYANSLISIAARQNVLFNGGLLAFGESSIKSRIKGIMSFKKAGLWIGVAAVAVILIFAALFLTDGLNNKAQQKSRDSDAILINDEYLESLLEHRSRYIGDASNVGNLLGKLTYGKDRNGMWLKTESAPYGITINYVLRDIDDENIKNVKPALVDNALILYSLIENVETVKFNIDSSIKKYEFEFKRTEMQKYFNKTLWEYSEDDESFRDFLLNTGVEIHVYPAAYSPFMSHVPGMQLQIALNGAYYGNNIKIRYSARKGALIVWENKNEYDLSSPVKTIEFGQEPVYWTPLGMTDKQDYVTVTIFDEKDNVIVEKQVDILKDSKGSGTFSAIQTPDVIID